LAIKAIISVNSAIRNISLYPLTSAAAAAVNSIETAFTAVKETLKHRENLVFAEHENQLLICGEPISREDRKKLQLSSLLELMLNLEFKNITFTRGLERSEFTTFLEIISTDSEDDKKIGRIKKTISERKFIHILIDQKVYISIDSKYKHSPSDTQEICLEDAFFPMLQTLDHILDPESKNQISYHMAASIALRDEDFLLNILSRKMNGNFGAQLFENLMEAIDEEKFEKLVFQIKEIVKKRKEENTDELSEAKDLLQILRDMIRSPKGAQLQLRIQNKKAKEQLDKKKNAPRLRSGLDNILSENNESFKDPEVMTYLPEAIEQLYAHKQNKAAEKFIARLGDGLLNNDPIIRKYVSNAISQLIDKLPYGLQIDVVKRLAYNLSDWLKIENTTNPVYEKLSIDLKDMAQIMLRKSQFGECNHILDAFHYVCQKDERQGKKSQITAQEIMAGLPGETIIKTLIDDFLADGGEKRKHATHTLIRLGPATAETIMEQLKNSDNRYERARVLKLLTEIGHVAAQYVVNHLKMGNPWYYTRNLILLLGKIGDKSHLKTLMPFLKYKDIRVRRECLFTICAIGEDQGEKTVLNALPDAGERFKIDIVKMLGRIKSQKAVPQLLKLLESESSEELQECTCVSLGYIGSSRAIPVLKSFFEKIKEGKDTKKRNVINAAAKAIGMIEKNQ
ncbi:HEAT repeat domain-containing protein, partial [Desulfobacterales bacterium HSG17]|nr:HEAT repeat domain-containing protein [Desulfobacterales bacterium HSG17]